MKNFGKRHGSGSGENGGRIHSGAIVSPLSGEKNKSTQEPCPTVRDLIAEELSIKAKTDQSAPKKQQSATNDFVAPKDLQDYLEELESGNLKMRTPAKPDDSYKTFLQRVEGFAEQITQEIHSTVDPRKLNEGTSDDIRKIIHECVEMISKHHRLNITVNEIATVKKIIEFDMIGLGPLEDLLADDEISDIMVDGPNEIFIEKHGKIERTDVHFRNTQHLMNVCHRIVGRVGRHVDESSPICDARLPDGSRVNVILPPLAMNGPVVTIRKFKKDRITLDTMIDLGTMTSRVSALLQIIAACRINVIISGGTGSGKTTLLNSMTRYISPHERIITCEDAAELQLQQPQVVKLECRTANTEGFGQVTMRDLVRNCLRMRPDRIIVGEVRGAEAFDLLQAMSTGHDGAIGTLHANNPRDALFRLETMVSMANLSISTSSIREQISSAVEVIVQIQRLRDGSRKIMNIAEVTGMEGNMITIQDLMYYEIKGEDEKEKIFGNFKFTGIRPRFLEKAREYGLDEALLEIISRDLH